MIGIVFYGTKKSVIDIDEIIRHCPSCESDSFAEIMVSSVYYHLYFMPIFPVGKEADIVCQKCSLRTYELPFNKKTIHNYDEIKKQFRHPWFVYAFLSIVSLIIVLSIIL